MYIIIIIITYQEENKNNWLKLKKDEKKIITRIKLLLYLIFYLLIINFPESDTAKLQTSLQKLTLSHDMISDELKSSICRSIDVDDDGSRVFKIRRFDNNLIPLSTLLSESSPERYRLLIIIRVANVENVVE